LLRQRRFLVLMSLALAGFHVLKVHVKGDAEYSGFALSILRPERVQLCVWVIFSWALMRYVQRLNELWPRVGAQLCNDANRQDQRMAIKVARRYAERTIAREGVLNCPEPRVISDPSIVPSVKEMIRETRKTPTQPVPKFKPEPWFVTTDGGGRKYRTFGIDISYLDKGGKRAPVGHNFDMPAWSALRARSHRLRAWANAAIRLPAVFEYLAPLGLAALAIATAILLIYLDHPAPGLWANNKAT
jgi:hypothetical protein